MMSTCSTDGKDTSVIAGIYIRVQSRGVILHVRMAEQTKKTPMDLYEISLLVNISLGF
jgi:hypothetical protein